MVYLHNKIYNKHRNSSDASVIQSNCFSVNLRLVNRYYSGLEDNFLMILDDAGRSILVENYSESKNIGIFLRANLPCERCFLVVGKEGLWGWGWGGDCHVDTRVH